LHIVKSWGLKGEIKALPLSDHFDILHPGKRVSVFTLDGLKEEKQITSIRKQNRFIILSFADVESPEVASRYRGATVNIQRKEYPDLIEGEFFYDEIIGIAVYTEEGEFLGEVHDIFNTGSNDVYVIKKNNKEYLIPAIKDVIKEIDIVSGRMIITLIDGLLD
jgi:16S rRNA processing protein RimM